MRKSRDILLIVLASLLLLPFLVAVGGSIALSTSKWRVFAVLSNSMTPFMKKGSGIVVRPCTFEDLQVGDIITYAKPSGSFVTHRLTNCDDSNALITKGDNNFFSDVPFPHTELVGKVVLVIPRLGLLMSNPTLFLLFAGVLFMLCGSGATFLFVKARRISLC